MTYRRSHATLYYGAGSLLSSLSLHEDTDTAAVPSIVAESSRERNLFFFISVFYLELIVIFVLN